MLTNNELCSPFVLSGLALYQRAKFEVDPWAISASSTVLYFLIIF